ncbi:MAG: tetratricopeptide repeat protein [Firmicutes bacterium]|nr:tetratricopeptide repeat protein [Bacillota bacterium]
MTDDKKGEPTLETLKIAGEEFGYAEIPGKYRIILEKFLASTRNSPDYDNFNRFIDMLWRTGHFDEALVVIEEAERKYPGDRNLVEKRGEILMDAGKLGEAGELFTQLQKLYPQRCLYAEFLGEIHRKTGALQRAEEQYQKALELSDNDPGFLLRRFDYMEQLAEIYFDLGEIALSLEYLEEVLTIHPRSSKWHLYFKILKKLGMDRELDRAKETWEWIKKSRRYHSRGIRHENQGKIELAIKNYKKAVETNNMEPHYLYCLGSALEKLPEDEFEFQFEEATVYLRKALELYPNNVFFALGLTGNLSHLHLWDDAYQVAAETGKKFPEIMLPSLRHLAFMLGKETDYISLIEEYIGLDTGHHFIELRSELAILLKERKKPEAEKWFAEAAELYLERMAYQPYSWRIYLDYANCLVETGKPELAEDNLLKAQDLRGEFDINISEKLMEVYFRLDQFEKTRDILTKIIPHFPSDYEYYGKLGMCFLYELDYEKAFEAFNRSLEINRYMPEYLYGAAVCASRLGNTDDAIAIIKDLLEMDKKFIKVIQEEDAFLQVKETKEFLEMQKKHEEGTQPAAASAPKMKKFIMPKGSAWTDKEVEHAIGQLSDERKMLALSGISADPENQEAKKQKAKKKVEIPEGEEPEEGSFDEEAGEELAEETGEESDENPDYESDEETEDQEETEDTEGDSDEQEQPAESPDGIPSDYKPLNIEDV